MEGVAGGARGPRRAGAVYFELLVTVGLFAIPATLRAIWVARYGHPPLEQSGVSFANFAVQELLIVALVVHIVRLHGERLADFTTAPRWSDVGWAVLLFVGGSLLYASVLVGIGSALRMPLETLVGARNFDMFIAPISWGYVALVLINPLCEETLLRAVLQTRLRQLGWSSAAIIAASDTTQAAYHVYQGPVSVVGIGLEMAFWAWFYERTRRLWPVIGAHAIADVGAMLVASRLAASA